MTLDLDHKKPDLLRPSQHLDDDDESHEKHAFPEATRKYFIEKGQQRVAQAAAVDPKKAHEASDKETIDAARATLVEHAALVNDATKAINAAVTAKHDVYARQRAAKDQFAIVVRAFEKLERYCQGVRLTPPQWRAELPQSVTALHRAYETFKAAMDTATDALALDDNVQDVEALLTKIHATTTVATTKDSAATPVARSHAELRIESVRENLEAAREASASILAGNSGESRRLTAHLRLLTKRELTEVKKDPRAYADLKKVIGEVVKNLDALVGRYPSNDQDETALVKLFRDQL